MNDAVERIVLDVHAHQAPIFPDDLKDIAGVSWNSANAVLTVDGHDVGVNALFDPRPLVSWMDQNGVEKAWISIPPPLYRPQLGDGDARAWAGYVNSGLRRIAEHHPRHLAPLFHLPIGRPRIALEVARDASDRGQNRFAAPAGGYDAQVLSDPALDPLWQVFDAAGAFVFFHPGECADGRLSAFYLSNLLGNPYETAVAIGHLVFGGVIERFPNIRFCFAHGGGALPMLAGRFERGFATKRPGLASEGKSPRALLKTICVDCITHDNDALDLAERVVGASNILFGSDWPFPMGLIRPHEQLATVDRVRRGRIFCDNPNELIARHANTSAMVADCVAEPAITEQLQ
jgi:aminocarboxymuconate-semialdehyde decarboxylase